MDGETWAEFQIREAIRRGDFDELPGSGKPLRGKDQPHDELWWVKQLAEREQLGDAMLPPGLLLRKRLEQLPETVARLRSEQAVRHAVDDLNRQITEWLRAPHGPWRAVAPVDPDDVVREWHAARRREQDEAPPAHADAAPVPRRRWRLIRRRPHPSG